MIIHGHWARNAPTPTYVTWGSMMERCLNPKSNRYPTYGARGIAGWSVRRALETPANQKQKRKLSICPHCKRRFYYRQYASKHARTAGHYGDYRP